MLKEETQTIFDAIDYTAENKAKHESIKEMVTKLYQIITNEISHSRELSLACTNLEQSFLWVGKALKVSQMQTLPVCDHGPYTISNGKPQAELILPTETI